MAKKIYCVKAGRKTGIYHTWDECKKQVDGFSGAIYKSFLKMDEAVSYMGDVSEKAKPESTNITEKPLKSNTDKAIAYVDGSYKHETREFSCGAVLFYKGDEKHFSKKYDDPSLAEMRNVAGEIMGSVTVIRYCLENNIPEIDVYHDYEGISRWAKGDWKANKEGTKSYRDFCQKSAQKMKINFVKVKGHSGDKYNDLADELAKKALGI